MHEKSFFRPAIKALVWLAFGKISIHRDLVMEKTAEKFIQNEAKSTANRCDVDLELEILL